MKKTYELLADSRQLRKRAGDTVEMTAKEAKYLVAAGVLELKADKPEAPRRGRKSGEVEAG